MSATAQVHHDLLSSVASRYRADGYEVALEPKPGLIPFDLGGYRPDIIAHKGDLNVIIEIKANGESTSFEQLRTVVEETKRHDGWRFVLVTAQDVAGSDLSEDSEQFSWEEIEQGIANADRLSTNGELDAAYLLLWVAFERTMRKLSLEVGLPLSRLAPAAIIRQLYSQGELTMAQFDTARYCQDMRNRLIHGFRVPDALEGYQRLRAMLDEVLSERTQSSHELRPL